MSLLEPVSIAPERPRTAPIPPNALAEAPVRPPRLASLDVLRGLVMVLMALDHTRDFFGSGGANPRDVADPALFLTRWITHFCAPTFILLAGISASLHGSRSGSVGELSRFLLTRGIWLVLMEFTLIRVGWSFDPGGGFLVAQVIWAIGASMIVLAGLVHLPRPTVAAVGLGLMAGHNLLDGIQADAFGPVAWVWTILHEAKVLRLGPEVSVLALYPLIPWIGVMAAGYALGPLFEAEPSVRVRRLVRWGVLATAGFLVLRAANLYGDPEPWRESGGALATALSFLNCEKYPPSLLYLLMTLGPALLLLAGLENARGRAAGSLETFGRVPFFFYVAHIYLIHALAISAASATGGRPDWGLPGVYVVAAIVVAVLHPLCRWYAALKRGPGWWWSYL